jgi:hypothetical protein
MAQEDEGEAASAPRPGTAICREPADLYTPRSKRSIARLAREFLDHVKVTPTELLHSPALQKQYMDMGTTYQAAAQKAALAQAQSANQNVQQGLRELYTCVDGAVSDTAARLKAKPPATIDPDTFHELIAAERAAQKSDTSEIPDFTINAAVAAYLAGTKTWGDKFDKLLLLADSAGGPEVHVIVDGLIAEIVDSKVALRELIGESETLGKHLEALVDLLGAPDEPKTEFAEGGRTLHRLLSSHPLSETRGALTRQLRRGLLSKNPLGGKNPAADLHAHLRLLERLTQAGDSAGGENTIALFSERLPKILSADTLSMVLRSVNKAEDRLVKALDIHRRLGTSPGRQQVRQYIYNVFEFERVPQQFTPEAGPLPETIKRVTTLHVAFVSSGLAEQHILKYVEPLEQAQTGLLPLLFKAVEKDNETAAARAVALLDLCADGTFMTGANLRTVHQQIRRYMSDESFATSFLADAPDKQTQTQRLAELHQKLLASGLAGTGNA